jgi:hypothetical protein
VGILARLGALQIEPLRTSDGAAVMAGRVIRGVTTCPWAAGVCAVGGVCPVTTRWVGGSRVVLRVVLGVGLLEVILGRVEDTGELLYLSLPSWEGAVCRALPAAPLGTWLRISCGTEVLLMCPWLGGPLGTGTVRGLGPP